MQQNSNKLKKNITPLKEESRNNEKSLVTSGLNLEHEESNQVPTTELIIELASSLEYFSDENSIGLVRIPLDGYLDVKPVRGGHFRAWLQKRFREKYNKLPPRGALLDAIDFLDGDTLLKRSERQLQSRVQEYEGAIWYDLADSQKRAIRIDENGWDIYNKVPLIFKSHKYQEEQVVPARDGDIWRVQRYVRVKEKYDILMLSLLCTLFIPVIPHPIVIYYGEYGAAKTTSSKVFKMLVDPAGKDSSAINMPRDLQTLIQVLSHQWLCNFDNLSYLSQSTSDLLCSAVTGVGTIKRQLYSDDEDLIFSIKRCIILNGIEVAATKADLLDRSILIELDRIDPTERLDENTFWREFNKDRPIILGGIFNVLSRAMKILPNIKLDKLFRMADFTLYGYAVAEALGNYGETFLKQYEMNISEQKGVLYETNSLVSAIDVLMAERTEWVGLTSELYKELIMVCKKSYIDMRSDTFPKGANALGRKLNNIKATLQKMGIEYSSLGHKNNGSKIIIRKIPSNTVT